MILDIQAVSEMFDVKRDTVNKWQQRGLLPPPAGHIARSPYWDRDDLVFWGIQTRRDFAGKAEMVKQGAIEP